MIAPTKFGFNEEAFKTNSFQNRPDPAFTSVNQTALEEFDRFVESLKELKVDVRRISDFGNSTTPDSIFPNNWFSTHSSGALCLYPMAVENRRAERRTDIIDDLKKEFGYQIIDFTHLENQNIYLEGTGSLLLDHDNKVAYGAISPRTHQVALEKFAKTLNFEPVAFEAYGKTGELIYHTNVMMCIGDKYIIVGMDTVKESDRKMLQQHLDNSGKQIIYLTNEQVYQHFGGNMLQIRNTDNETILVMSSQARKSLNADQLNQLESLNDHILAPEIPTIESVGGGSVRCMIAEIFSPLS